MIAAVRRVFEVKRCGPVVGEVISHLAGGTGGSSADVAFHGGIESIAANDMVYVSGGKRSGLRGGIEALEG
jgi:hypothetical protein